MFVRLEVMVMGIGRLLKICLGLSDLSVSVIELEISYERLDKGITVGRYTDPPAKGLTF